MDNGDDIEEDFKKIVDDSVDDFVVIGDGDGDADGDGDDDGDVKGDDNTASEDVNVNPVNWYKD